MKGFISLYQEKNLKKELSFQAFQTRDSGSLDKLQTVTATVGGHCVREVRQESQRDSSE